MDALTEVQQTLADEDLVLAEGTRLRSEVGELFALEAAPGRFLNDGEMLRAGVAAVRAISERLLSWGLPLERIDPGHALGHIIRDHVSALLIAPRVPEASRTARFAAIVAGSLHDIGCAVFNRYEDAQGAVRHADASGVLLRKVLDAGVAGVTEGEARLIVYAAAAHTHYLKRMEVKGRDGETRVLEPFPDEQDGRPLWSAWLTRWADRLDVNGPAFVGRHFLTLGEGHKDYASDVGFYETEFSGHLAPLFRAPEEIKAAGKRTMLEHMEMFRASQTNASAYGRFDNAGMQELRDARAVQLGRVIDAVRRAEPRLPEEHILAAWTAFLAVTVEPHEAVGRPRAEQLVEAFRHLPAETRRAWCAGFEEAMLQYRDAWYPGLDRALGPLADAGINHAQLALFGANVWDVVRPRMAWSSLLP